MHETISLFSSRGEGTLALWDPTRKLVVAGPYLRVRNPMITGVGLVLAGEAMALGSVAILIELGIFALANALWMPLIEEPGLVRRFGDSYLAYRRAVPRWIPRRRPWTGEPGSSSAESAAGSSATIRESVNWTRPAGIEGSPASSLASGSCFSSPVTSQRSRWARAERRVGEGHAAVALVGVGGEATRRSLTSSTGSPGTSEAVWPSGPRPRWTRSSRSGSELRTRGGGLEVALGDRHRPQRGLVLERERQRPGG